MGLGCPLFLMLSGGGLTTLDTAARFPIRLVESGPAGGAIFSAHVARQRGLDRVLSFDMGGTTAKVCLIDGGRAAGQPDLRGGARRPVQEGLRPAAPHPGDRDGGDRRRRRLARALDAMGRIQVGPESAGADPGPACYGRGGARPAVTDANLLLGRYDPERFAGGSMRLDTGAAEAALASQVGGGLGLSPAMAALGVVEVVDEGDGERRPRPRGRERQGL